MPIKDSYYGRYPREGEAAARVALILDEYDQPHTGDGWRIAELESYTGLSAGAIDRALADLVGEGVAICSTPGYTRNRRWRRSDVPLPQKYKRWRTLIIEGEHAPSLRRCPYCEGRFPVEGCTHDAGHSRA